MAHSAKTLTALGAGIAILAAAFAGTPATAFERTTGLTEAKPIVLAQAKKKKKKKTTLQHEIAQEVDHQADPDAPAPRQLRRLKVPNSTTLERTSARHCTSSCTDQRPHPDRYKPDLVCSQWADGMYGLRTAYPSEQPSAHLYAHFTQCRETL